MNYELPESFQEEYHKASDQGVNEGDKPKTDYVQPGTYLAVCVEVRQVASDKNFGFAPIWQITATCAGKETGENGKRVEQKAIWLSEKAMWRVAAFLKMLNIHVSDRQVFNDSVIIGRFASIDVQDDTFTSKNTGDPVTVSRVAEAAPAVDQSLNEETRDASDPKWQAAASH